MQPRFFPPPESAGTEGLVRVGGLLTPDWLLDAYRHGIFPWPMQNGVLAWFSPDPRAVIELDCLHISRRLHDTLRAGRFRVTFDENFAAIIDGCATAPGRRGHTWITPSMIEAYVRLHELGHAHSVEVWRGDELAGGTYGVAIGGLFAGESMFHRIRDASKIAVVRLVERLRERGFTLLDIQQLTPHTASLGAVEISRQEYLQRAAKAVEQTTTFV